MKQKSFEIISAVQMNLILGGSLLSICRVSEIVEVTLYHFAHQIVVVLKVQ
jgi:hypothetical protein